MRERGVLEYENEEYEVGREKKERRTSSQEKVGNGNLKEKEGEKNKKKLARGGRRE